MQEKTSSSTQWFQDDNRLSLNEKLEVVDSDIINFAIRRVPRNVVPSKMIAYEIDELAQNTRIKLWLELLKGQVMNPKAYAYRISCTEAVDMVRRFRKASLLLVDNYDVLDQAEIMTASDQRIQDPAVKYEEEEEEEEVAFAEVIVKGILALPPRQQYAMLCILKKKAINIQPLLDALLKHGLDLEAVCWPEEKDEQQRLRASFLIARRKLRDHLKTR